ncbi:Protein DA1 [Vitis vinifera]|uniref:Protein DA1 n=1 Tax=Vitis vinifera TaxID=29760 RepID=A0A438K1D7_VITVI|nr:Protein DA1 [Vitis vinifera]
MRKESDRPPIRYVYARKGKRSVLPPGGILHNHKEHYQIMPCFCIFLDRICAGCNTEIGHGRFLSCMGAVWHPECFRCHGCGYPISDYEYSMNGNYPYHKSCYKEHYHPKCDVCKHFIPTNPAGLIEYRAHPFWVQKYCPSHEHDRTPRCCSCERMEPRDTRYVALNDGRKLCLECLDSAIMDTNECQPLYLDIQEFYEGLNMKVQQQVPLLLVERQALNEAMEGEKSVRANVIKNFIPAMNHGSNECQPLISCSTKLYEDLDMTMKQQVSLLWFERQALNEAMERRTELKGKLNKFICFLVLDQGHHHMPETRGLCLSEEQTVSTILRRPKIGTGNRVMNMITEPCKLTRRCDVTAVLILYGLPRYSSIISICCCTCYL